MRQSNRNKTAPTHRIAILSDVHGNLPALEAVVDDAHQQDVTEFWNLGDFLGYGPFPNEVIDLLFEICSAHVIGNYDLKVLDFPQKRDAWQKSKKKEKFLAFQWAREKLSDQNAVRLRNLPEQKHLQIERLKVLLTHGGPAAVDEAIGPETPGERLAELADMAKADIVLCGHTHQPFSTIARGVTFLNPGSVGRPEGEDPRASYAILEIFTDTFTFLFQKVPYDVQRTVQAIHDAGLPVEYADMLKRGKNLDQIQNGKLKAAEMKMPDNPARLEQIRDFARRCNYEQQHSEHVTKLAEILFKRLTMLHGFRDRELFLLTSAGILHDIGLAVDEKGHNKISMQMILEDVSMPLSQRERKAIALIARYHRKTLPSLSHPIWPELSMIDQSTVQWLAGILRIADGLDRTHMSVVRDIRVEVMPEIVEFHCKTSAPALAEMAAAGKKADLLEKILGCEIRFISQ